MKKFSIFITLFIAFILYSIFVYTNGTRGITANSEDVEGKLLFQKYNCTACHQLYGLGGYLGPELTYYMIEGGKGAIYARAILRTGTERMPDFHLKDEEINALIEFLKYVNTTTVTYKNKI